MLVAVAVRGPRSQHRARAEREMTADNHTQSHNRAPARDVLPPLVALPPATRRVDRARRLHGRKQGRHLPVDRGAVRRQGDVARRAAGRRRQRDARVRDPSQRTSRQINESLRTDDFVARVRTAAGIPADSLVVTLEDVRSSLSASAGGQSLLAVNASTVDPQLAQRLVQSTIDTYIKDVIDNQVLDSTTTLNYLTERPPSTRPKGRSDRARCSRT